MILPLPNQVSIPATSVGTTLLYDDTSISVLDTGEEGLIEMKTDNKKALTIDTNQKIGINNPSSTTSQVTINSNVNNPLALFINNTFPTHFQLNPVNGDFSIQATGTKIRLNKIVDIVDHNKTSTGLALAGTLVTSTASQLNYVDVPQGAAVASKALILDSTKSITGIQTLQATELSGTVQTSYQPNITSVNTLNIVEHNGSNRGLRLNGQLILATATELNYTKVNVIGIAQQGRALIMDNSLNISNINTLSANQLNGTIQTISQPNITSIGTLNQLSVNGKVGIGYSGQDTEYMVDVREVDGKCIRLSRTDITNSKFALLSIQNDGSLFISASGDSVNIDASNNLYVHSHDGITRGLWLNNQLVKASADQINYTVVTPGNGQANKALVLDGNRNINNIQTIQATNIVGTIQTAYQPNINEVDSLRIKLHNGSTNGLYLNNILVEASAEELNYTNITTRGVAESNKALVVDVNRSISNINVLGCSQINGTVLTQYQPNINKVDTLAISVHDGSTTGLILGTQLVTATATQLNYVNTTPGVGSALKSLILNQNRDISNINSLTASSISGTIQTPNQPNITSVNTLNIVGHNSSTSGLSLNGILVTASAAQLNYLNITPGITEPNKALILNSSKSIIGINQLSASVLIGSIFTPSQPFIESVTTLDITDHNGSSKGLKLGGVLVTASASELNYTDTVPGIAAASKALVLDSSLSISGIQSISSVSISGTLQTPSQPNISQVNELNISNHNGSTLGLKLNNVLVTCTADQINRVNTIEGIASPSKSLIVDIQKNITGINTLSANTLIGTVQTSNQPNISYVNTLNIGNHNGTTTGLSLNGTLITATADQINYLKAVVGTALPVTALVVDVTRSITNINALSASTITGTLQTGFQPNITSVNTLNILNHNGSSGLSLNGSLVIASADQLNTTAVNPGFSTPLKALVTNSVNSISGLNTINATKVVAESIDISGVIKNLNTGGLRTKTYSSIDFIGRVIDTQIFSATSFSNIITGGLTNNYSMEIIGYILPQYSETYTFFIQCQDRVRLWVNNRLILCSWNYVATARISNPIFLNGGSWYPIYIQYQVDSNNSLFLLEWTSSSTPRNAIPASRLAWDNNNPNHNITQHTQNALVIYNSSTASLNQTSFTVDNSGDLVIDSSGNDVKFGTADNVDIPSHNGTTSGLFLGGQLVTPTAFELNYLKVSPGTATPTHALVVDGTNSITGITSLASTSLSCTNLFASNFSISNLTLTGPLENYNTGNLMIKQITGADLSGRVVDVSLTPTLSLSDYDPQQLNNTFSLEISGYILPQYSENYIFYITVNDRARLWVNNKLILNAWDTFTSVEHSSIQIPLQMNQWTRIYIQFQNITGSSSLQVKWSSPSTSKSFINSSFMAWDNRDFSTPSKIHALDSITLSPSSGLIGLQTSNLSIDTSGSMIIGTSGNTITIDSQNSLNISGHNGTNKGLLLNGILVTASATEINYLSGSSFGVAGGGKVMILDNNRNITNINSLTATTLNGTLSSGPQPNITSIGTVTSTFSISSDMFVGDLGSGTNGRIRLAALDGVSYIQSGTNNTINNANDLMIGNINADTVSSSRKFMIKSNGFVGIQTNMPNRTLTINGSGNAYAMRMVHNNNNGSETNGFVDIGVDSNGNAIIAPNGSSCNILSTLRVGTDVSNGTLSMNGSSLNITSTSGSVQIGNTVSTNLPLEIGSTNFSIPVSNYGYINSSGSTGSKTDTTINTFSLRTTGRIIVGGEVDIISDGRSKEEVQPLSIDFCKQFIEKVQSVSFKYKNTVEQKIHYGYIAQDIYKAGFESLVSTIPDETMKEKIDEDGFKHPQNQKFVLCYDEIIPILSTTIKDLYEENIQLKETVSSLIDEIKWIKSKLI
jgi:hypothetical protein